MISIGNLAAGGRAKTPLAAFVAERLRARGERPAILSRGYGRRDAPDGVVVVRDPDGIRTDVDRAGDEPLMLARQLDGVAVLVSPDRYLAGRLAELHFGCTVHVLDDGFQHFVLHRDADVIAVAAEDLEGLTLPGGPLREPLDASSAADAFIALDGAELSHLAGGRPVWRVKRTLRDVPRARAFAVGGIAHPRSFFDGLRAAGCEVAGEWPFADHHRYTRGDLDRILERARGVHASMVVTTEKDLVRLLPFRPFALPFVGVPLALDVEDSAGFEAWLVAAVERARAPVGAGVGQRCRE